MTDRLQNPPAQLETPPHAAKIKAHGKFSWIWAIPIVAASLVAYLAYTSYSKRGPTITLTFSSADGLQVDQTLVKHKAVTLGTVQDISLAADMSHVVVKVQMDSTAANIMTDHARFWVVKPRFSAGSFTGIDTLVSGAYIEVDPGVPGGKKVTQFTGLEEPPGRTSDEPGKVFVLKAPKLGSLGSGSPLYYRDVAVGEVLSADLGDGLGAVTMRVFVKEPYAKFVHPETRFWNASGISFTMGAEGMHVELESLQTLISGGIAFETPGMNEADPEADDETKFQLYSDKATADAAFFTQTIPYVGYFETSIQGLAKGSPVQLFGVQVGSVTEVKLVYDSDKKRMVARVEFELQPERVMNNAQANNVAVPDMLLKAFLDTGMRVQLESTSMLTGSKDLALVYDAKVKPDKLPKEGNAVVLPTSGGDISDITAQLADVAKKVNTIPFQDIGDNLNATLASFNHLAQQVDTNATPALQQLPGMMDQMNQAVAKANLALGPGGYGQNSDMQHGLERLLNQVNDAARSVRTLADYLDRHPEALIEGRAGAGNK